MLLKLLSIKSPDSFVIRCGRKVCVPKWLAADTTTSNGRVVHHADNGIWTKTAAAQAPLLTTASVTLLGVLIISGAIHGRVPRSVATPVRAKAQTRQHCHACPQCSTNVHCPTGVLMQLFNCVRWRQPAGARCIAQPPVLLSAITGPLNSNC
jgi:hypothetical protein